MSECPLGWHEWSHLTEPITHTMHEDHDKRIAELEARNLGLQGELAAHGPHCFAGIERERQRADRLKEHKERLEDKLIRADTRAENAEAEVERLKHLGGVPPGVLPPPPAWWNADRCDWCDEHRQALSKCAARKERAP